MCIYVRELTAEEGNKLKKYLRNGNNSVTINRIECEFSKDQKLVEIKKRNLVGWGGTN